MEKLIRGLVSPKLIQRAMEEDKDVELRDWEDVQITFRPERMIGTLVYTGKVGEKTYWLHVSLCENQSLLFGR